MWNRIIAVAQEKCRAKARIYVNRNSNGPRNQAHDVKLKNKALSGRLHRELMNTAFVRRFDGDIQATNFHRFAAIGQTTKGRQH